MAKQPNLPFKEFPPRGKAASVAVSDAMEKIEVASPNQN